MFPCSNTTGRFDVVLDYNLNKINQYLMKFTYDITFKMSVGKANRKQKNMETGKKRKKENNSVYLHHMVI